MLNKKHGRYYHHLYFATYTHHKEACVSFRVVGVEGIAHMGKPIFASKELGVSAIEFTGDSTIEGTVKFDGVAHWDFGTITTCRKEQLDQLHEITSRVHAEAMYYNERNYTDDPIEDAIQYFLRQFGTNLKRVCFMGNHIVIISQGLEGAWQFDLMVNGTPVCIDETVHIFRDIAPFMTVAILIGRRRDNDAVENLATTDEAKASFIDALLHPITHDITFMHDNANAEISDAQLQLLQDLLQVDESGSTKIKRWAFGNTRYLEPIEEFKP